MQARGLVRYTLSAKHAEPGGVDGLCADAAVATVALRVSCCAYRAPFNPARRSIATLYQVNFRAAYSPISPNCAATPRRLKIMAADPRSPGGRTTNTLLLLLDATAERPERRTSAIGILKRRRKNG
ncbi:hypothetical protein FQR65_LT20366 [Abscondita terminalis]|nr:hypothetical protein FQR65_LT20366 [Abscondita terminalis]